MGTQRQPGIPGIQRFDDGHNDGCRFAADRIATARKRHFPNHFGGRFSENAFGPSM